MMTYILPNIRALLIEGFTDRELRRLCYDLPEFRPVYEELAQSSGKTEIVDRLIEYAEQKILLDTLLDLAQEQNPARYSHHQPYQTDATTSTPKKSDQKIELPSGKIDKTMLREEIVARYSLEKIRTLSEDLGIDYEELGYTSKESLARELIRELERQGKLAQLQETINRSA